ncbi:hypothetical protein FMEAI12_4620009 [Parafrankia sp. Ea1.12]|nr:hypothetical protein FMEAI12_4620009 [Parafrankia sp. Ea1.12]
MTTSHSAVSFVAITGGSSAQRRSGRRPNTSRNRPSFPLCTSNRRTSAACSVIPVSSLSSRTTASRQASSSSMKPPGSASSPRPGSMSRRTTTRPRPPSGSTTGSNATATGSGLSHVVSPQPAHTRGHATSGWYFVPQYEQNEFRMTHDHIRSAPARLPNACAVHGDIRPPASGYPPLRSP